MTEATPGGASRPAQPRLAYPPSYAEELKHRVLDELALVQGRIKVAETLDPNMAKEEFRRRTATSAVPACSRLESGCLVAKTTSCRTSLTVTRSIPLGSTRLLSLCERRKTWTCLSTPLCSGQCRSRAGTGALRFLVRDRQNGKLIAIFALGTQLSRNLPTGHSHWMEHRAAKQPALQRVRRIRSRCR